MSDFVNKKTRSKLMARIRSKGNQSTELKMRMILVRNGVSGWQLHPKGLFGNPDFVFSAEKLALFVDGCFWHGCPKCGHLPKTNIKYWHEKLSRNIARDKKTRAKLRRDGWSVIQVWEHQLNNPEQALKKVINALGKRVL